MELVHALKLSVVLLSFVVVMEGEKKIEKERERVGKKVMNLTGRWSKSFQRIKTR